MGSVIQARGVLYSGEMVRAQLDGLKTITRRIIKPQPDFDLGEVLYVEPVLDNTYSLHYRSSDDEECGEWFVRCPYGKPGDLNYVRETWYSDRGGKQLLGYPATDDIPHGEVYRIKPSIHMSRWASRLTNRLTAVRAERLQAITEEDAQAEGCQIVGWAEDLPMPAGFAGVWDSMYAKPRRAKRNPYTGQPGHCYVSYPWEDVQVVRIHNGLKHYVVGNPLVWVLSYEVIRQNVDTVLRELGAA